MPRHLFARNLLIICTISLLPASSSWPGRPYERRGSGCLTGFSVFLFEAATGLEVLPQVLLQPARAHIMIIIIIMMILVIIIVLISIIIIITSTSGDGGGGDGGISIMIITIIIIIPLLLSLSLSS